jgi:hypothetical protein
MVASHGIESKERLEQPTVSWNQLTVAKLLVAS